MSRPYRITTGAPHPGTTVVATDEVNTRIEVPPILPPEATAGILAQILRERGFEEDGGKLAREDGGVRVEVDPNDGGVRISAEESADVPVEDDRGGGCTCATRLRQAAREAARDNVAKGLQGRVTGRLEKALAAIGCELERVGNQVAGKALVAKARTLGDVKRIEHDNETGGLTIVVEV